VTLAGVSAKYATRIAGLEPVHGFVAQIDGGDVGYFQYYRLADLPTYAQSIGDLTGWCGIDFFLGSMRYRGRHLAAPVIGAFGDLIGRAAPGTRIALSPTQSQRAALCGAAHRPIRGCRRFSDMVVMRAW
jgi:hypothetical protein